MKLSRLAWLCLLPLPSLLPLAAYAQPSSFTEAWQQVLKVSDKLQAQSQEVNRAKGEQEAGESLNLPSLSLNGSYTHLEKPIELDLRDLNPLASGSLPLPPELGGILASIPGSLFVTPFTEQDIFRASLQAMWPIYTGGQITAAQGIHAAMVAEKQQELQLATRDLFTQLVDRYYAVDVTQSLVSTQTELVASLTKHVDHALALEREGQIAKVERLNAQVALDNAKVNLGSARRQHEMAVIALSRMLQRSDVSTNSPLFVLPQAPSLGDLTQMTLNQHPALKLLEAKEAQANGLVSLEKGKYHPTVFLFGNYTLYEDDSLFSKVEPDWMVGVGVKVPLLSRDGRSGKVEAAKSALLQARYTKAQTRQDLSLLLDQSYRQLLQAEEEFKALNTSLELATENLRLREIAFNQGLSTSIDRVDAELKLSAVKTQQLGASYRYVQAYARLMAISGQLDEFIGRSATGTQSQETINAR
ncbi:MULTISPECIES: TolC family protein [Shewanella]|uniref:TolC family protein n=1 Tax=Shewanella TaxID=22 RepID=UPI000648EB1B|nr:MULTISPECIES: TolC family protein [Shewanella]PZP29313.1 MAG: TolC family protein [Shewanella oneidensis]MCL1072100.1 TolC family protein [Shewanella xiamenensis]MCR4536181.1 TolC family protein [Shewanella xiamenensis]MCT8858982.1 TolC family protein [Shewanella xiamenensis]MCT8865072.1 TolC family protein [Shewanella xiamenensis]